MISIEKDKDKKINPSKDRAWWQHAISQQLADLLHTLSIGSSICFKSGLETAKMHLIFAALLLLARKELRQKRHSFTRFWNEQNMIMIICHVSKYADNDEGFDEFLTKLFKKGDNSELPSSASEQCFSGCSFFSCTVFPILC